MSGSQPLRTEPVVTSADPGLFRAGRDPEDATGALIDRVAFALAVERGTGAPSDAALAGLRGEATVALTNFAFRHLHNSVAEIRQQAVAEHLSGLRPPLGFGAILLASLIGSAVVAAGALWLHANPGVLAGFVG